MYFGNANVTGCYNYTGTWGSYSDGRFKFNVQENVKGLEFITEAARVVDCHIIHISTDYVFDGSRGPYSEVDTPNPFGYYARTKLASENALKIGGAPFTILRTNVLYGIIKTGRADFVRWVVDSIRNEKPIRIVTDQINNPTFLDDLCEGVIFLLNQGVNGTFHLAGGERLSKYDLALKIANQFRLDPSRIIPVESKSMPNLSIYPRDNSLDISKIKYVGYVPCDVDEGLTRYAQQR